jgi:hypothetical protein
MSEEAWAAGDAPAGSGGSGGLPPLADGGMSINQAFSLEVYLRNGMRLLSEQPGLALAGAGLVFLVTVLSFGIQQLITLGGNASGDQSAMIVAQVVASSVSILFSFFQQLVMVGAWVALAEYIATDRVSFGLLFSSFGAMIRVLVYSLVAGFLMIGVMLVCVGPGGALIGVGAVQEMPALIGVGALLALVGFAPVFYVALGVQLGMYAAALDGAWPVEALRTSWESSRGARVTLFVLGLVVGLLTLLGLCLMGVGMILVNAVSFGGVAAGWLLHTRGEAMQSAPFFQRNPVAGA